ncbi:MAG: penicillin-binding protein 1C [Desulfovibrio sp.]|nr:penicillin-binding protein 1C [Desulfovibrio sp.]
MLGQIGKKRLLGLFAGCVLVVLWWSLGLVPLPHPLEGRDFSTIVRDREGKCLRMTLTKDEKYRLRMDLVRLPAWALDKVVAYEDRFFWYHPGVNVFAILRSLVTMLGGGRRMGGSTLTMQTVRLAYGVETKHVLGKLKQIFLALVLERKYSKAEILEAYFSLAPYGGNVEGLEAAAAVYFHTEAARLTQWEAEALMLVPQNPVLRRPSADNPRFMEVVRREVFHGDEVPRLHIHTTRDLPFLAPHFVEEVLAGNVGQNLVTTLDSAKQKLLERGVERFIARHTAYGIHNCAALLVHWPSHEVRALVGSAHFQRMQVDGTKIRRSPGSTLKPFIYALALEQGLIHPMTLLVDTPKSFRGYDPENFDHSFMGPVSATTALRMSRNVPAIALASRLRNPDLYDFLVAAGVSLQKSREYYGLALVLGGAEVTMREEAALYAMLANRGVWKPLRFLKAEPEPFGKQLLSPEASFLTLSMLTEEVVRSKGQRLFVRSKTGTSNGFRDAWTCGCIGSYVLVVWVGNFDNSPNPLFVGARIAEPFFMEIARSLAWAEPMEDVLREPWPGINVEKIPVCRETGDIDTSLCAEKTQTWFIPGVSPIQNTGIYRKIRVSTKTGLRLCEEMSTEEAEERVWAFWPSELAVLFDRAGTPKPPPPPFDPACSPMISGNPPTIRTPKLGLTYHASFLAGGVAHLGLMAHAEADVGILHWYIDGQWVAKTLPGAIASISLSPGSYRVMVVDDHNRSSFRMLRVAAAP